MIRKLSEEEIQNINDKFSYGKPEDMFRPEYQMILLGGLELDPHLSGLYLMKEIYNRTFLKNITSAKSSNDQLNLWYKPNCPCSESQLYLEEKLNNETFPLVAIIADYEYPGLSMNETWLDNAFLAPIEKALFYSKIPYSEEVETVLFSNNQWLINPPKSVIDSCRGFYDLLYGD